jgi:hypothetical protein
MAEFGTQVDQQIFKGTKALMESQNKQQNSLINKQLSPENCGEFLKKIARTLHTKLMQPKLPTTYPKYPSANQTQKITPLNFVI